MTTTKAQEFEARADAGALGSLGSWAIHNRSLIARALRRDEAIETALRDNELACGHCGEFFSGDPPVGVCPSARDGKHDVLVVLRGKDVRA